MSEGEWIEDLREEYSSSGPHTPSNTGLTPVEEVPAICPDSVRDAQDYLVSFINQGLAPVLTYRDWVEDKLTICCDDLKDSYVDLMYNEMPLDDVTDELTNDAIWAVMSIWSIEGDDKTLEEF